MSTSIKISSQRVPCDHFRSHAFLNLDRCRDCGFSLSDHTNHVKSPVHEPAYHIDKARASIYTNQQCTHFTAHYWLWNRCRDCARSEGVHTTSDGQHKHLNNPYQSWITYVNTHMVQLNDLTTVNACEQRLKQLQHEIVSVNEDYMKLRTMQTDLLLGKQLTQHEYDGRIIALNDVHNRKLSDLNSEILGVQRHQQYLSVNKPVQYESKVAEVDDSVVDIQNTVAGIISRVIDTAILNADRADLIIHDESEEKQSDELNTSTEDATQRLWKQLPESEWHIKVGDITIQQLAARSTFVPRVEKLMQTGRHFIRYTSSSNKGQFISLFIRQLPGSTQYTLYWAPANNRTIQPTRAIPFSDIQAIVLGTQSSTLQNKRVSYDCPESHCMSIIGSHSSLHLQAGSQSDRDIWAYGLQRLIACKTGDNKLFHVQLFANGQYKESRDRLSIERSGEKQETGDIVTEPTHSDVTSIQRRDMGKQITVNLSIKGENLHTATTHHNYIVCLIGRNLKTDQPEYLGQTDRAGVDQLFHTELNIVYENNIRAGHATKYRLNVYDVPMTADTIEDEYRVGSCILDYTHINQPISTQLSLKLHHKDSAKNALLTNCLLHVTINKRAEIPLSTPFNWPPRVVDKFMDSLSFGTAVTLYSTAEKSHQVTLFYRVNKSLDASKIPDVGTLYYVPTGRELSEEKKWSLPVYRITDVYRGRRSDNFPHTVDDNCCVSFVIDNGKRLDVVCENAQQRDLWVGGVVNILNAARSYKKRLPL